MMSFPFPQRLSLNALQRRPRFLPTRVLLYAVPLILLAACNIDQPNNPTPTVEILISATATATRTPTPEASLTPTFTASPQINMQTPIVIVSAAPNNVPNIPTAPVTVAPLETPTPWTYIIKEGDTLAGILAIQPWGYNGFDSAIQRAVVQLNNMISPDIIPPPGTELLIPQVTWTPIPEGVELTQAAMGSIGCSGTAGTLCVPEGTVFDCYTTEAGDTMIEISINYSASFELLSNLNRNLNWGGCNFTNPTGGPNCNPPIGIDQCIMVPLPTGTPVPTSTLTGSETPTATPTRAAARLIYPADGAIMSGGTFRLDWVSAGLLASDQVYLIEVQDVTAGTPPWLQVTRDNSLDLPGTLVPSDGQTHQFQWRVTVVKKDPAGTYAMSDGQGTWRPFQWQSR